jgi:hypothetical protein
VILTTEEIIREQEQGDGSFGNPFVNYDNEFWFTTSQIRVTRYGFLVIQPNILQSSPGFDCRTFGVGTSVELNFLWDCYLGVLLGSFGSYFECVKCYYPTVVNDFKIVTKKLDCIRNEFAREQEKRDRALKGTTLKIL